MLDTGGHAPDFKLKDSSGEEVSLSDFKGRNVIVYFYPKDNTPGCTVEAEGFRDLYHEIEKTGAVLLGISPDSVESHGKFRTKFNLPFRLLSDEGHKIAEAYGAWGEKKMYGKTSMGIIRSTFIIDAQGRIVKVFPKVSPKGHSNEVIEALKQLQP